MRRVLYIEYSSSIFYTILEFSGSGDNRILVVGDQSSDNRYLVSVGWIWRRSLYEI